jgi:hypothetical protein
MNIRGISQQSTRAIWSGLSQLSRLQNCVSKNTSMNTRLNTLATAAVFAGFGLLLCLSGCGKRSTPPAPSTIITSAPGLKITFLRWKEGLMVLFVDNVKGSPHSGGSGSTDSPVHTASGSVGNVDAGGYQWQLEATGGKSANCRINGKDYDLSKGGLFVITTKGEQAEVNQLKRDLSTIPFDTDRCREPLVKDVEIRKALGLDDRPE